MDKPEPQEPELSETDAMIVTLVTVDAFCSLPSDMDTGLARGALLMFDQIMWRVRPLLPKTPAMQHIFDGIAKVEEIGHAIRERHNLDRQSRH